MSFTAEWLKELGDPRPADERHKSIQLLNESYARLLSGYGADVAALIKEGLLPADQSAGQEITIGPLPFQSLCEHHLLPFTGTLQITYVPDEYILGLGRFPRAVEAMCARLTLQEKLTVEIADIFYQNLKPKTITVTLSAHHLCMRLGHEETHNTALTTSVKRGH